MEMKSTNPVLRNIDVNPQASPLGAERMTINGTIGKTFVLLALVIASGAWTWSRFSTAMAASGDMAAAAATVTPFLWGGMIAGFVLAMITIFKRQYAGFTAPLYALAQGLFLGAISAMMELRYPGIVMQAVMLTMAVLVVMLLAYRGGWIRVTDKFRTCVVAATGAVALLYLVDIGLRSFTSIQIPFIHETGLMGIGFSAVVIVLAALNLVLDFDIIDRASAQGAPKYMEWYGAFALMVTLVWLYLEILRLLSKLRR